MMGTLGQPEWMQALFGKTQSWYDNLSRLQKELSILNAEVEAIGSSMWNAVKAKVMSSSTLRESAATRGVYQPLQYSFEQSRNMILMGLRGVIVTDGHVPSDMEISRAGTTISEFKPLVEFIKSVAPEIAGKITDEANAMESRIRGIQLTSPSAAAIKSLPGEIIKQGEKILGAAGSFGFGAGIGIAVAAGIALFIFSRR